MTAWTATTGPVSRPSELKNLETLQDGRTLGKQGKAQFEAAKKAAGELLSTFEQANVALSGAVDEDGVTKVQITVAKAE